MAVHGGPKVAAPDGLVLALDVGNKKTFANSVINSTSWSLGSGSATGYNQNGATAENERVTGTDPFGKSATVWETRPQGNNADDGGWNTDWYNIDNTKLHRFSVWVKRTTDTSGGTFYLGLYGNASGIRRTDNNTVEGNPYWDCRGTGGFTKDVWYLVVGHCYPYNTTYTGQHPESGIYTVAGGATKVLSINACNIGADVKWAGSDVTQTIHRCYHYYCGDNTTRLQLFDPRIDVIDGTEPTIRDLLSGFTANRLTDLIGTNNGTFTNGPTYSSANGGSLSFDGTDDYVNAPLTKTATCTFSCWARTTTVASSPMLFNAGPNGVGPDLFFYSGNIYWNTWDGAGNPFATMPTSATNGNYHYYVVVNDASSNTKLYYDGNLLGTAAYRTAANNTNLTIGGNINTYMWNGNISNFSVYNRALTAAEVQQNFNANRSRFGI